MLKRRNIREAAIQFLYLADLEDGSEASEMQDAFWELTQESSLKKLAHAKAKAILHIAQGRDSRLAKLIQNAPAHQALLKTDEDTRPLASLLTKIISQENKLSNTLGTLKTAFQSKTESPSLAQLIEDIFQANQSLLTLRQQWHQTLEDFPAWKNKLEPITAAINHLQRISERLNAIDDPDSTLTDFAHLRASNLEISIFRKETQTLVDGILKHQKTIDESLAAVIENYAPGRVAPVDRAILRLAAYEIAHCEDIPRAVSINEAIEIAKRFGSNDSARFVNGVLDAL